MTTIKDQLRRNSVAIISLVVAISSLSYNSWRNEQSEANRNVRTAGIELLNKLGDFDRTALHVQFGMEDESMHERQALRRTGWAYVLNIRDLGSLTPSPARESSAELYNVWRQHEAKLGTSNTEHFEAVSAATDQARRDVLIVLGMLD